MKFDIKKIAPHIISILVIMSICIMYFYPQFEGKVVRQSDISIYTGMVQEIKEYKEKTGEEVLWTNSMFGGMPGYQISPQSKSNQLKYAKSILSLGFARPVGTFLMGMIGFYIMMLLLGINPWLSLVGSIIFGLSTNNIILWEAGHTSKLNTIMVSPLIIGGLILVFRKKYLIGGAMFALSLGLNVMSNHPQMTYYLALCCAILVIIELVNAIKNGEMPHFAKAIATLAIGGILALGASMSTIWTTYEYSKDTMRGKPILKAESTTEASSNSSAVDGLAWDYAMQWSNTSMDLLASLIPGVVGGGSQEPVAKSTQLSKRTRIKKASLYWGGLPFTSGPIYFGAIALFLFLLGALVYKGQIKWWLVAAVILTMLMSMGKHSFINRLLFDYLPWFNKFRTPNSVLSVTALFIPVLGLLGLNEIVKSEDKTKFIKPLFIAAGVLAGISLILAFLGGSLFDFSHPSDARSYQGNQQVIDMVQDARAALLKSSAFRSALLILVSAGMIYLFLKNKVSSLVMMAVVLSLTAFDLFQIDKRYLSHDEFVRKNKVASQFTPRPVDTQILKDSDPHYRVYDATINTFNSSSSSYFHKTIGGNHAAKLQRIDDLINRHISRNNIGVLSMLNTKYFIVPGSNNQPVAQTNPAAFGNAWFVSELITVPNANAEIDSLSGNDLKRKAFVHQEYEGYINGLNPSGQGSISLTSYSPMKLVYKSSSSSDQFANFSEVWYGPNKGWQAYIDGQPVDHIRTNYILRGLKVPAGDHEIVFEFRPKSYYAGSTISLITSILIWLLVGFAAYKLFTNKEDNELEPQTA